MSSKINVEKIIDNERKNIFLPLKFNSQDIEDYIEFDTSDKIYDSILFDKKILYNSNIKFDTQL